MNSEHSSDASRIQLGEGFFIETADRQFVLMTRPQNPLVKWLMRVGVQLGPFLVIGFAFLYGVHTVILNQFQSSSAQASPPLVLFVWAAVLILSIFLTVLCSGIGKPTRVRFRLGMRGGITKKIASIGGGDPDELLSIRLKQRNSTTNHSAPRDDFFNLRVQQDGIEDVPMGGDAKVVQGRGAWWLRFETKHYQPWCINLAVADSNADRLAQLVSETVGRECLVVRRIED